MHNRFVTLSIILIVAAAATFSGCGGGGGGSAISPRSDGKIAVPAQALALVSDSGQSTSLALSAPAATVSPGQEFTYIVSVNERAQMAWASLRLEFDKTVFSCIDVSGGWSAPAAAQVLKNPAAAAIAIASTSPLAPAGTSASAASSSTSELASFRLRALPSARPQNARIRLHAVLTDARGTTLGRTEAAGTVKTSSVARPQASTRLIGDLLGTGQAEVGSAIKILRVIVGLDAGPSAADLPIWDCNSSGNVDVGDAIRILRCVVQLEAWPISTGGLNLAAYFPLNVGDQTQFDVTGRTAQYAHTQVLDTRTVSGVSCMRVILAPDMSYTYYAWTANGLRLVRRSIAHTAGSASDYDAPDQPLYVLPASMNVGQSVTTSYTSHRYNSSGVAQWQTTATQTVTLEAVETVNAAGGSFSDCLRIKTVTDSKWTTTRHEEVTQWLAPGKGIVKMQLQAQESGRSPESWTFSAVAGIVNGTLFGQTGHVSLYVPHAPATLKFDAPFRENGGSWTTPVTQTTVLELADTTTFPGHMGIKARSTYTPVDVTKESVSYYWRELGDNLYNMIGFQGSGSTTAELFNPIRTILRGPLTVGASWQYETDSYDGTPMTGTTTVAEDNATVTVPAGTFTGCVKLFSRATTDAGGVSTMVEKTEWWPRGLGMYAKQEYHLTDTWTDGTYSTDSMETLTSYSYE